jgi:hypothetical protein
VTARIGDVPVGTRVLTLFTRRQGWVRAQLPKLGELGETRVRFDDAVVDRLVHSQVLVAVVELPWRILN